MAIHFYQISSRVCDAYCTFYTYPTLGLGAVWILEAERAYDVVKVMQEAGGFTFLPLGYQRLIRVSVLGPPIIYTFLNECVPKEYTELIKHLYSAQQKAIQFVYSIALGIGLIRSMVDRKILFFYQFAGATAVSLGINHLKGERAKKVIIIAYLINFFSFVYLQFKGDSSANFDSFRIEKHYILMSIRSEILNGNLTQCSKILAVLGRYLIAGRNVPRQIPPEEQDMIDVDLITELMLEDLLEDIDRVINRIQEEQETEDIDRVINRTQEEQETIDAGTDFLLEAIIPKLNQEELESFKDSDNKIMPYVLSKAIYLYCVGEKKGVEIPNFFKNETKKTIEQLRNIEITEKTIKRLDHRFLSLENYEEEVKDGDAENVLKRINEAGNRELQKGVFLIDCWQNAAKIEQGTKFLLKSIIPELNLEDLKVFKEDPAAITPYILTKVSYLYSIGKKKGEELPEFFLPETKKWIQDLRKHTIPEKAVKWLEKRYSSYEEYLKPIPMEYVEVDGDFFFASSSELGRGSFLAKCWKNTTKKLSTQGSLNSFQG